MPAAKPPRIKAAGAATVRLEGSTDGRSWAKINPIIASAQESVAATKRHLDRPARSWCWHGSYMDACPLCAEEAEVLYDAASMAADPGARRVGGDPRRPSGPAPVATPFRSSNN